MNDGERLAVIDLGSNSFRLVVFMAGGGWWRRTDEIYEPVRIGEGLAASGRLGEEPMRRALATLDVFDHFCRAARLGEGEIDAVATSAIRDAENAAGFLALAREHTSLPIRVLSREQEARYAYLAAVNSTTLTDGCVLDLGGGSLQLVRVAGRKAHELESWQLGAVRMTEQFLPADGGRRKAERRQIDELREHVARELARAEWLQSDGSGESRGSSKAHRSRGAHGSHESHGARARGSLRLVGMGGTVRNLAAAVQRAEGLPSNGVQAARVRAQTLEELIERLAALPASERSSVPGIKPARADLILAGAIVVEGVLQAGGFEELEATEAGLREGVFFERLLAGSGMLAQGAPPGSASSEMLAQRMSTGTVGSEISAQRMSTGTSTGEAGSAGSEALAQGASAGSAGSAGSVERELPLFADLRRESVLNLAAQYLPEMTHTEHVATLALAMFDELARLRLHAGDPVERELLWAASMLHDIGMSVDYDDHHKHSRYLILNAGLPGYSQTEVAIIAQAARYHRKGMPDPGPLSALFGPGDAQRLDRCAVLLRLAEDLERSRDQVVRSARVAIDNGSVELRLVADGEPAVPRWAASREGELFARAFHRELSVAA